MGRRTWLWRLGVLALVVSGCGKSDPGAAKSSTDNASPAAGASSAAAPASEPSPVVSAFLDAIRTGNDSKAMTLLTPLARQKAIESNRTPTPPASDTAKYEVGQVEYVGDDIARVDCRWIDLDETGKPRTDRAIWVCRRCDEGWRVAGVAAVVFDGEPPLLLNFEDPAEMAKKQKWLADEIAKRAQADNPTAHEPTSPVQAEKSPPQDAFRR